MGETGDAKLVEGEKSKPKGVINICGQNQLGLLVLKIVHVKFLLLKSKSKSLA